MTTISPYNIIYLILLSLLVQLIESAPDPLDELTINVNIGGGNGTDTTVKCGVKKKGTQLKSGTSRIVGGNETEVNEYPWIVLFKSGGEFHCGGVVIADKWILTAAHCLHKQHLEDIELILGEHDRKDTMESSITKTVYPNLMISHPKFVWGGRWTLPYDIGLLRVPPIDIKTYTPICLPAQGAHYTKKNAWIYGWGHTAPRRSRNLSKKLLDAQVLVVSDAEAWEKFAAGVPGERDPLYLTDEELDVMNFAGLPGIDTCQGDSGGPMSYSNPDNNGRHEQIGITSWGWGCAGITPGVYTEVSALRSWIDDQMANN